MTKSIYTKRDFLAAMLPLFIGTPSLFDDCDKYANPKSHTCKQCGKSFHPVSHNKTVFCSAECYKTYKQLNEV